MFRAVSSPSFHLHFGLATQKLISELSGVDTTVNPSTDFSEHIVFLPDIMEERVYAITFQHNEYSRVVSDFNWHQQMWKTA